MPYYQQWKPYVPVAKRRARAEKKMQALRKKGVDIQPVQIEGRKIAREFWGQSWCDHLESFSDYDNRLPRGRTYVRNGSVCHLGIARGKVEAKVVGTEIYEVEIKIGTLSKKTWQAVKRQCTGQIGSLIELLQGRLSDHIMEIVTDREEGLFPSPDEISFECDCPDWAYMCKHVAAVMYGIGARLDTNPTQLFLLRGVSHDDLIDADAKVAVPVGKKTGSKKLAENDLSDIFGIALDTEHATPPAPSAAKGRAKAANRQSTRRKNTKQVAKKANKKRAVRKKASAKKATKKKATKKKSAKKKMRKKKATKTAAKKPKKAVAKKGVVKKTKKKSRHTTKSKKKIR